MKLPNLNLKKQLLVLRNLCLCSLGKMSRELGGQIVFFGSHFRGVRKEKISATDYLQN